MSEMELFISESTKKEVEDIMMKKVKNAFHQVDFGANPQGIYSACAPDEIHCIEEGVIKHVTSLVVKDYLTAQHRAHLDKHAKKLHLSFRQCSKVNFPRCSFPNGVSDLSNMESHEHVGLLFMLIVIFQWMSRNLLSMMFGIVSIFFSESLTPSRWYFVFTSQ